jgi:TonB family protein
MPTTPPQLDETTPNDPETPPEPLKPGVPLSFVPHNGEGEAVPAQIKFRSARFGELDEHELIHLLDSIEDERARARFRESIYISLFVWIAIALLIFFGPKYLWHAPQLISPAEALMQTNPVLPHHASPAPKIDKGTLNKIREMTPKPAAAAPKAVPAPSPAAEPESRQPTPASPAPIQPALPVAPAPIPHSNAPPVPNAPIPQPATRPTFSTGGTVSDQMHDLASNPSPRGGSLGGGGGIGGNTRRDGRGASAGVGGPEILSDTQGVDFQPYLGRLMRQIYQQWIPLIPEEAQPPLNKQGVTRIRFTINPDGSLAAIHLDGPSGDVALDRAAWGSVNGQIFPPLPKQFTGPNLELRVHYLVNVSKE